MKRNILLLFLAIFLLPSMSAAAPAGEVPPIDRNVPENVKSAVFALGCFWGPDARFGRLEGVIRTRVGYAGGTTENPTYRSIGDHTESIEIVYDPSVISYEELLDLFWESHNPAARPYSRQYMSLILYRNDEQKRAAEKSLEEREKIIGKEIRTQIVPLDIFYQAEDYHQKYNLKGNSVILEDLRRYYPDPQGITDSTAAARINGYLGRYGSKKELEREIESFGLTEEGEKALLRRF